MGRLRNWWRRVRGVEIVDVPWGTMGSLVLRVQWNAVGEPFVRNANCYIALLPGGKTQGSAAGIWRPLFGERVAELYKEDTDGA